MDKLAITRMAKELRKIWTSLGPTEAARRSAAAANPAAHPRLRRFMDALKDEKGMHRRTVADVKHGDEVAEGAAGRMVVGFNPQKGFVANKQYLDKELPGRVYRPGSSKAGENMVDEARKARKWATEHDLDKMQHPNKPRAAISRVIAADPGQRMTGKIRMDVGNTTMDVPASHSLIRRRLSGGAVSRGGKVKRRKPDTEFRDEITELGKDGLGRLKKPKAPRPILQSTLMDVGQGAPSPAARADLGEYLKRMRQRGLKITDLHGSNLGGRTNLGKERKRIALFDYGEVHPTTLGKP
ncbi:MAG: hypothetical protein HN396_17650 [Gemmatimonadales bacterium]|nr:hypothetical protein [Gemmatimonadales bacterium]